MSARAIVLLTIPSLTLALAPPDDPHPARSGVISIRYESATPSSKAAVVVNGIDAENLAKLRKTDWDASRWADLLSVSISSGKTKRLPMAGSYRVAGETLRFEPKYPIEPGLHYAARFEPSHLPIATADNACQFEFDGPAASVSAPAFVARVEPSGDVLPENLLKFYVTFSAPMSRGEVYSRVRLLDSAGKVVELAFLELGEELWDTTGTRITLLLDPGRIKRGLRPREEEGPILEAGRSYTLQVDREWPDATGKPMREPFREAFRAGPADMTQPDPKGWKVQAPSASTRDPLTITFPEPLDRAMLDRALVVRTTDGKAVAGRTSIDEGSTRWKFTPERPWTAGSFTLEVDPELEDLAGNSIARPFEVDAQGLVVAAKEVRVVRLPITISAQRRP